MTGRVILVTIALLASFASSLQAQSGDPEKLRDQVAELRTTSSELAVLVRSVMRDRATLALLVEDLLGRVAKLESAAPQGSDKVLAEIREKLDRQQQDIELLAEAIDEFAKKPGRLAAKRRRQVGTTAPFRRDKP